MTVRDTTGAFRSEIIPTLGERQKAVYDELEAHGPMTNLDVAYALHLPINSVTPRTNELVKPAVVTEREHRAYFRRITQDVRPPMPDYQDVLAHVRRIEIPAADLARWEAAAERLQQVTPAVLLEVSDLHADPCKHRLGRAANAARYAASIADEPLKTEAIALAEELEQRSV